MKNLTHYFRNDAAETDSHRSSTESVLKSESGLPSDELLQSKQKKKNNRSKPSGPTVSNASEFVSSSSPPEDNQKTKKRAAKVKEKCPSSFAEELENGEEKTEGNTNKSLVSAKQKIEKKGESSKERSDGEENKTSKINAFQLMMESRNKSIGRNSPGRDRNEEEDDGETSNKQQLSVRRSLLQKWADRKGGLKRRRDEEQTEETIKIKLEKRAKRLKHMLTSKPKKLLVVDSDPENSGDSDENGKEVQQRQKLKSKSSKCSESQRKKGGKVKNSSDSESTIIKIKMFSPKKKQVACEVQQKQSRKKKKKSRLSLTTMKETEEQIILDVDDDSTPNDCGKAKHGCGGLSVSTTQTSLEIHVDGYHEKPQKHTRHKSLDERSTAKIKTKTANEDRNADNNESDVHPPLRRSSRTKTQRKQIQEIIYYTDEELAGIISSDEESNKVEEEKRPIKLAPIFLRNFPKPALDPALVEAKRNFLHSSIPDSLKKFMEKQKSAEMSEVEVFPKVSHVQQKNTESALWNLPLVNLPLSMRQSPVKNVKETSLGFLKAMEHVSTFPERALGRPACANLNVRQILKGIKEEYPEFPVYRTFRLLREKNRKFKAKDKVEVKESQSKKHKKRKNSDRREKFRTKEEEKLDEDVSPEFTVWTEKYKAQSSEDILGNSAAVRELKHWLGSWVELSREISSQRTKRKHRGSSSSEFDTSDGDSRDSVGLPMNTVIVSGPVAAGKTMAVYAVARELDINVLELNASSKRTGKRLLQDLQEATQSHQVRKHDTDNLLNMYSRQKKYPTSDEDEKKKNRKKMCLLLVDDVDIVFDQDEGFLYSLNQLLSTSKRPIVLVTSDISVPHLYKFASQHKVIKFNSVSDKILSTWLQLVCLLEGLHVTRRGIQELLRYNLGDVRKTLLQLQFWVTTGGEPSRKVDAEELVSKVSAEPLEDMCGDDDNSRLSWLEEQKTDELETAKHDYCPQRFLNVCNSEDFELLRHLNEDTLWCNFRLILESFKSIEEKKKSVQHAASILDSHSSVDLLTGVLKLEDKSKFCSNSWKSAVRDSLELRESTQDYRSGDDLAEEIRHCILETSFRVHMKASEKVVLNIGLPDMDQWRWRKDRHKCDEAFSEVIPYFMRTDRRANVVDYLPCLRNMYRLELRRLETNNKRHNRFYSYLQGLGIKCNESIFKNAATVFSGGCEAC